MTSTHCAFRIEMWTDDEKEVVEHLADVERQLSDARWRALEVRPADAERPPYSTATWHEKSVGHALLEMPDHMRLASRDRN